MIISKKLDVSGVKLLNVNLYRVSQNCLPTEKREYLDKCDNQNFKEKKCYLKRSSRKDILNLTNQS
jgi:hypothetical protein